VTDDLGVWKIEKKDTAIITMLSQIDRKLASLIKILEDYNANHEETNQHLENISRMIQDKV